MPRHYRYISADSHLEIDSKHWLERLPAKYRDIAPLLVGQSDGSDAWAINDNVRPAAAADLYGGKGRDAYVPFGGKYEGTPGTGSPEQRVKEQDRVSVELRDKIGVDRLMWGSDFPHQESDWPNSTGVIERNFAGLPAAESYKMVCGNAVDFFRLTASRARRP